NYPFGATILWPPLFDCLIAWPALLFGGSATTVERVAAAVPVVLGVATLPLIAGLGTTVIGPRAGLHAAMLLSILPAHVEFTILGRADQHAAELFFTCWIFLAFVASLRRDPPVGARRWVTPTLLGLGIALAFWNWMGSGFSLLIMTLFAAVWHVLAPADGGATRAARALGEGSAVGAALLALSILLVAPDALFRMSARGVSGFHVTLVLVTAGFGALLLLARRMRPDGPRVRRAGEVLLAGLVPVGAALMLLPGLGAGVRHHLGALTASSSWYADIEEFGPLLLGGWDPLRVELNRMLREFGLTLLGMPLCIPAFVRAWRGRPGDRVTLAFLAWWGALVAVLTVVRVRFVLYAAVPAVLWITLGIDELARWLPTRFPHRSSLLAWTTPVIGVLVVAAPGVPSLAPGWLRPSDVLTAAEPSLKWLRDVPSPVPGRESVLSSWQLGHSIQYYAGKPVIASPFGTDAGAEAMVDLAAFYYAPDQKAAEWVLERRRTAFVLLGNPMNDLHTLFGFAFPGAPKVVRLTRDWLRGGYLEVADAFFRLPVSHLYFFDGSGAVPGRAALSIYRLLFESPSSKPAQRAQENQFKLFGVVPGAVLVIENAKPGSLVLATAPLRSNQDRVFSWTTFVHADASGRASLRVPYASGLNGRVAAGAYTVTDGVQVRRVIVGETEVVVGGSISVSLRGVTKANRSR
ncbi:MAG TPA: STT3 domain-containing protein, partial [Candidatus Methylomirabilis sp.]|nr:STT3 domain-containing protein [Candidatus Methylomirabilis sp.]